jgi:hypothetical protein
MTASREGTQCVQQLPTSPDAFVWLRLYQAQMQGQVPAGRDQPLWWTLRRLFRQLTYHAAHRMFTRAGTVLGADWTSMTCAIQRPTGWPEIRPWRLHRLS